MEQVITNGKEAKAKIIESISKARTIVKVAMAYFTDREIANELIASSQKGLEVKVVLASDATNVEIQQLLRGKVSLINYESNGRGIMHHKFCIIDNSLLLHGSYNYTYNATNNNQESLNITDSISLINEYGQIFENLIKDASISNIYINEKPVFQPKEDDNYLESFTEQLKNHISQIFDEVNHTEIIEEGKKLAEENNGAENSFIAYLETSLSQVNSRISQNDHTKTLVKTRMTASLEKAVENNNKDLESDLNLLSNYCEEKKVIIQGKIETIRNREKEKQENYNKVNSEVSKLRTTINELTDEIDSLDIQIIVRSFWTFPTLLKLLLATLFFMYLSLFFSSAIWKIFFEEAHVYKELSKGITPEAPPLFDANALVKIFSKKGPFYGAIGALFFLVPVLLTSIKLLNNKNKFIEIAVGWVIGIFAIDVVIAILISQHTFEIQRLLAGGSEKWALGNAFATGEFWLIFIFGALPLFITKMIIENIWLAYNKSNPESVDREKALARNSCKRKLSENQQEFEGLKVRLDSITIEINELKEDVKKLEEDRMNIESYESNKKLEFKERNEKRNKNLRDVYNSFIGSVDSGNKQFLKDVISGRISAFKTGYYIYFNKLYLPNIAANFIDKLEAAQRNWEKETLSKMKKTFNILFALILIIISSCTFDETKEQDEVIEYENIIIYSDLSSRMDEKVSDTIIINQLIDYFVSKCVMPGVKVNDRSVLSFSRLNHQKSKCTTKTINIGEIKDLNEKQKFVNNQSSKNNLNDEINELKQIIRCNYSERDIGGLDVLSLIYREINSGNRIKNNEFIIGEEDTTTLKFNNHLFIFTDGYLEYSTEASSDEFYFGDNKIKTLRTFCIKNKLSPEEAISKNKEFRIRPLKAKNNGIINLYILETDERGHDVNTGTIKNTGDLSDNNLLRLVWENWARESGFKSFVWKEKSSPTDITKTYVSSIIQEGKRNILTK